MSKRVKFPKGILTYDEAAAKLGCSSRTLQRYVAQKKIPVDIQYVIGGRRGFLLSGIEKIVKGGGIR